MTRYPDSIARISIRHVRLLPRILIREDAEDEEGDEATKHVIVAINVTNLDILGETARSVQVQVRARTQQTPIIHTKTKKQKISFAAVLRHWSPIQV